MRLFRDNQQANAPKRALLLLCAALVMLLGLTRHFVMCTHQDGDMHIEFVHAEGQAVGHVHPHRHPHGHPHGHACCGGGCGLSSDAPAPADGDEDPHDSCKHVVLDVDVGEMPCGDALPAWAPRHELAIWLPLEPIAGWIGAARNHRAPPATGPPIRMRIAPSTTLEWRRCTVLLI
ncbi:MAG: hypothetical protein AB8H80_08080 [Planctomycetota bacterium]